MKKWIKQNASRAVQSGFFENLVGAAEKLPDRDSGLLRVLTYHRVDEIEAHPDLDPGLISATPAAFEEQIRYLAKNMNPVSIETVLDALRSGQAGRLPPRAVLVTFDDAYQDFETNAWPVLQKYSLPVVLFVATAFVDNPELAFWWDRLYAAIHTTTEPVLEAAPLGQLPLATPSDRRQAYKSLVNHIKSLQHDKAMAEVEALCQAMQYPPAKNHVLGWNSLRRLAQAGVSLGAHTRTHPLMNRISLEQAGKEALGSLQDLRGQVGPVQPVLAYPAGGVSAGVAAMLAKAGFELAFTTQRGLNHIDQDNPLLLKRINVGQRTNLALLRAQLLPFSGALLQAAG